MMPGSQEIEKKVGTYEDIRDIANAMRALAGLTVRKTGRSLLSVREYESGVRDAIGNILAHFPQSYTVSKAGEGRVLVAFGSDIGLCGPFNDRMALFAAKTMRKDDTLFVIGKKLREKLDVMRVQCAGSMGSAATVEGIRAAMMESFSRIADLYSREKITGLELLFFRLSEKMETAEPVALKVLPPGTELHQEPQREKPMLYLPSELVFEESMREFLYISVYRCYIESLRTENWFRWRSMEGAMENIDALIRDSDALYRYLRQEEVTEEIMEIIESHSQAIPARSHGGDAFP